MVAIGFAQLFDKSEIDIPEGTIDSTTVPSILEIVFPIIGLIALIIIILAGFKYVKSRGNPSETAKAKNTIIYAVIGLVVSMSAYTIVAFVIQRI